MAENLEGRVLARLSLPRGNYVLEVYRGERIVLTLERERKIVQQMCLPPEIVPELISALVKAVTAETPHA